MHTKLALIASGLLSAVMALGTATHVIQERMGETVQHEVTR